MISYFVESCVAKMKVTKILMSFYLRPENIRQRVHK